MPRPLIFPEAGDITLVKYNTDGTLSLTDASKYVSANGVIESITPNIELKTSTLPNGNSDWELGPYDTGKGGSLEVKFSTFQPNIYAAILGVSKVSETTQNFWKSNEAKTIPSASSYVVTLENPVVAGGVIVITDNTGSPFVSVGSGPAVSQFMVSNDEVTFNSADGGKQVFVTYQYATTTSERISLPSAPSLRVPLHAIISGKAKSDDETQEFPINIIIDKCKASSATPPPMQRTPAGWTVTLNFMEPRSGYNAYDWNVETS